MEFFKIHRTIPFMRHAKVFNIISLITFLLAILFLATRSLHFSIEFTGGTVMEVSYANTAEPEKIRGSLQAMGLTDVSVQNFGTSRDVLTRLPLHKAQGEQTPTSQSAERDKQAAQVLEALK